jgi:hypothetical protein
MIINLTSSTYFPLIDGTSFVVQSNVRALLELGHQVNVFTVDGCKSKYGENVFTFKIEGNGRIFNGFKGEIDNYLYSLKEQSVPSALNIYHGWHSWTTNLALDLDLKCITQVVYSHGIGFATLETFIMRSIRKILYFGQKERINIFMNKLDAMIFISDDPNHPRNYDLNNFKKKKFIINNPIIERNLIFKIQDQKNIDYINLLLESSKFLFLNISNFQKVKNQKFLIDLINEFEHDVNILFIGSQNNSYLDNLKKYSIKLKNAHRIHFLCNVSDYVIEYSFAKSNCFLFSSLNDFVPLVLIEANKFSLPFISFKTADIKRLGGFFVDNESEYRSTLLKVYSDLQYLNDIGKKGYNYYLDYNTFDKYKANIKELIYSLYE